MKNRNDYNKREFIEDPKSYIIVILMKKRLQIIKLFGRPLNHSYPIKLYQERK